MKTALVFFLCLVLLPPLFAQPLSVRIHRDILMAQDTRDAVALSRFLQDETSSIRARAAFAAGTVQDTALTPQLENLLNDQSADVRQASAFALGQMNYEVDSTDRRRISNALLRQLKREKTERVTLRIIEALGKMGDAKSLSELLEAADSGLSKNTRAEMSLSIGRYGYRGMKSVRATSFAAQALSEGVGWKAAYALFRIGDEDLLAGHAKVIIGAASDQDPNVRMYVAAILGKVLSSSSEPELMLRLAEADRDWRVRVNALKALSPFVLRNSSRVISVMLKAIDDSCEHVSISALSAIGMVDSMHTVSDRIVEKLEQVVANESVRYSRGECREAAISFAGLKGAGAFQPLTRWMNDAMLSRRVYVEAIGNIPSDEALQTLIDEGRTSDSRIQLLVLEGMLRSVALRKPSAQQAQVLRSAFLDALSSNDMAVITTASEALSESLFASPICVPTLLHVLERLRASGDTEATVAVIRSLTIMKDERAVPLLENTLQDSNYTVALEASNALQKILGPTYHKSPTRRRAQPHTDFDWTLLDEVKEHPIVTIKTSRGLIRFELLPDEAPFTCTNFASLIRKGFFSGCTFHRVVPNFVIQGGDPRGDGWGGPGYSIRSEFGYEHYERGAVGMASSGKDTEGSQFFVTHSRQPHLDGRYTIFGRVIAGMDVVDLIQVRDTIRTMTFAESSAQRREH